MSKERIICGTPEDPAWNLGDKDCIFNPDHQPDLDQTGRPICKQNGMFPGDPAIKIIAEVKALAAAAKKASGN